MSTTIQLTDDLLLQALRKRTAHDPSPALLGRIVEAAAATPQAAAPVRLPRVHSLSRPWLRLPALAGLAAAAVVVAMLAGVLRPPTEPAATPLPTPSPTQTATPGPTPATVRLGDATALRLRLGSGTGPIDVIDAFGSIWVAEILRNEVIRLDAATMEVTGRVHVQGPGWFVEADNALWVTNQLGGLGLSRIDPVTVTEVARIGDVPTCGHPVVAFGSVWFSACDADAYVRIDPSTNTVVKTIRASSRTFLELVAGRLVVIGPKGLATLDPTTYEFTPVPGAPGVGGSLIGADDVAAWVRIDGEVRRIDPASGRTIAAFPYPDAAIMTAAEGHAVLTVNVVGIVDIDLATNTVARTIPLPSLSGLARSFDGVVWATDFDNHDLWRIEP